MNENIKLISEEDLPIPMPATDLAWENMLQRLEDEMPKRMVPVPLSPLKPTTSKHLRLLILSLIILLISDTIWISNEIINSKGNGENNLTGQKSKLLPTNEVPKSSNYQTIELSNYSLPSNPGFKNNLADPRQNNQDQPPPKATKLSSNTKRSNKNNSVFKQDSNHTPLNIQTEWLPPFAATTDELPVDNVFTKTELKNIPGNPGNSNYKGISSTPEPQQDHSWHFEGGIYWPLQIPSSNTGAFVSGYDGSSQPYRLIIPGVWIQALADKRLMTLELNPFASNLVPSKVFNATTNYYSTPDTIVTISSSKTLLKTFGFNAGVGYAHNFKSNWWLGGSVQAYWWRKALASNSGEIQKQPVNGNPSSSSTFNTEYSISDEWIYFSKFQINLNAEIMYRHSAWQGGFRIGLPVTPLANEEGPSYPIRIEIFYRLKIFTLKNTAIENANKNWLAN